MKLSDEVLGLLDVEESLRFNTNIEVKNYLKNKNIYWDKVSKSASEDIIFSYLGNDIAIWYRNKILEII